jgi:predicted metalloprotease with PDZ domain
MARIHLHADATDATSRRLRATTEVHGPFSSGRVDLAFPRWVPGSYMLREQVQYVDSIAAYDEDGVPLKVVRPDPHRLRIRVPEGASSVRVDYEVLGMEMSVRSTHLDASHLHLMPPFTWYLPDDKHLWDSGAEVHLRLPDAWTPHTQLRSVDATGGTHRYVAEDRDALLDGIIEANDGPVRRFDVDGRPHVLTVWDSGGLPVDEGRLDAFVRDATLIAKEHHALFGVPTYDPYVIVLQLTDGARGGLEHSGSQTSMMPRSCLKPGEKAGYRDLLSLFSHEYVHQWNVKRLRPKAFLEYDLSREVPTDLLWWFEGGTSWIGDLVCLRSGAWTEQDWKDEFALKLARHRPRNGCAHESLAESSETAWIHLYRGNAFTSERRISYYLQGELAMMALDVELRRRSRGTHGLDDVMATAVRLHARDGSDPGVDHRRLRSLLTSTPGGRRLGATMDRLMTERAPPPVEAMLASLGLTLEVKEANDDERGGWLGIALRTDGSSLRVASHHDGSPLRDVVQPGDELIAVDGHRITSNDDLRRALAGRGGSIVDVLYSHEGAVASANVTLGLASEHAPVVIGGRGNSLWRRITASRQDA